MIYLDNNSTTKMDKRVIEEMIPFMSELYANPSSNHEFGARVKKQLDLSKLKIAEYLNTKSRNLIFTSGSTESINQAIKGIGYSNKSTRNKIAYISTEHKAVIESSKYLENFGYETISIPVKSDGLLDLNLLNELIDESTILLSAMLVNNETGVILPISEISEIAKNRGCLLFCDATQAVGKMNVDVNEIKADMLCFSAHKFYGPKGIGILYLSDEVINSKIVPPLLSGGGHENGLRSGTYNVPSIIGLAKAIEIVNAELSIWQREIGELRDKLELEILKIEGTSVNGNQQNRVFNTSNICFRYNDIYEFQSYFKEIYVSNGSACNSRNLEPSHVLLAMGLEDENASNSIRFTLGKDNTENEVKMTINSLSNFNLN